MQLNNNLMSRPEWITDETGKITGYKTPGGADTVFPFIDLSKIYLSFYRSRTSRHPVIYSDAAGLYLDARGSVDGGYLMIEGGIISGINSNITAMASLIYANGAGTVVGNNGAGGDVVYKVLFG